MNKVDGSHLVAVLSNPVTWKSAQGRLPLEELAAGNTKKVKWNIWWTVDDRQSRECPAIMVAVVRIPFIC